MAMTLIDDGSRFVPWSPDPIIGLEHIHRYRWAQSFVANQRVLDIACGEGYGSALLAQTARHVTSVDLDLPALQHAKAHYQLPNLTFVQANAEHFALAPHSIDVAVCFETLEHLQAHDALLTTIKTALTDEGILLISTPNKQVYTDDVAFHNPHHVRELYYDEFATLLKRYFGYTKILGQAVVIGSVLSQNQDGVFLHNSQQLEVTSFEQTPDQRIVSADTKLAPRYFVAYCAQQPLTQGTSTLLLASQPSANSALTDLTSALHESDDYARNLEALLASLKTAEVNARDFINQRMQNLNEAVAYARNLETRIADLEGEHRHLHTTYAEAVTYARNLETRVADLEGEHRHLHTTYTEAVAYARSLEAKIHDLEENLRQFTDIRK